MNSMKLNKSLGSRIIHHQLTSIAKKSIPPLLLEKEQKYGCKEKQIQAVAELGHTRISSCQLGQCSDQVERDRVGMVLVTKRNFLKV